MALSVPDSDQLRVRMHLTESEFEEIESEWVDDSLQRATDLFSIATGLDEDPTEELDLRVMNSGITAMAHALLVRSEDADAIYSPFSSERMGSYSYSKALQAANTHSGTGVDEFDQAVAYFNSMPDEDGNTMLVSVTSEEVFTIGFEESEAEIRNGPFPWQDPSFPVG